MTIGGIMLIPFLFLFGDLPTVAWQQIQFWKTLLYLTIFTTMATFFLQQYLVQQVGPNRLLAFTYLIPGLVAISQGISSPQLLNSLPGIALTLLALYLISRTHIFRTQTSSVESKAPWIFRHKCKILLVILQSQAVDYKRLTLTSTDYAQNLNTTKRGNYS